MTTVDRLLADTVQRRDLNEVEARQLVDSIRVDVADIETRIATAYVGRAWVALGYASWDAMCEAEFDGARLRVPREVRAEQVRSLRDSGLSTRAIGSALGVGDATVRRDLSTASDDAVAPDRIVGRDGKERPASQSARPQQPEHWRPPGTGTYEARTAYLAAEVRRADEQRAEAAENRRITDEPDDGFTRCVSCGDDVIAPSSRGWCDACEAEASAPSETEPDDTWSPDDDLDHGSPLDDPAEVMPPVPDPPRSQPDDAADLAAGAALGKALRDTGALDDVERKAQRARWSKAIAPIAVIATMDPEQVRAVLTASEVAAAQLAVRGLVAWMKKLDEAGRPGLRLAGGRS